MKEVKNTNKWKNALLKSSLPLEYIIANRLNKLGVYIAGEFSYLRTNENGIKTEFSTDILAFKFLEENKKKMIFGLVSIF